MIGEGSEARAGATIPSKGSSWLAILSSIFAIACMITRVKRESNSEREFSTMIAFLSALSFGLMLALAQAVRMGQAGISIRLSPWTAVAFLAGFNALFVYLELIFLCREKTSAFFRRGGLLVLVLLTLSGLLYSLRTLGITRQPQRYVGAGVALCFIGTGLTLVRRFVRAAEREEQQQEALEHEVALHKWDSAAEAPPI
jgi:hypothetical protein